MQDKKAMLEPDFIYHIYNRANGKEKLFVDEAHYRFFLDKYRQYVHPIVDTLCYCLMPNHFHLLVRINSEEELQKAFSEANLQGFISKQFSNFFNSYSKAFNKQQNRKGNLFMHTFKRKLITNDTYLLKLIHYNPVEAGLCENIEGWKFSSYQAIVSNKPTLVKRKEVIVCFENLENFEYTALNISPNYQELKTFD